jgi:hypothetical protein
MIQSSAALIVLAGISVTSSIVVPIVVSAATALITMIVTRSNNATDRRRDRYAEAITTLVAWVEFPYRVRRRTDDASETLTTLSALGHDIQERLACHQAWIATEHPALARTYANARKVVNDAVAPAVQEAWSSPPVASASEMNLGEWGPGRETQGSIDELQRAIQDRFGVRRMLAAFGIKSRQ